MIYVLIAAGLILNGFAEEKPSNEVFQNKTQQQIGAINALRNAVLENDVGAAKDIMIKKNPNINTLDSDGETVLFTAIRNNFAKMVLLLLNHGANPCLPNTKGETPLDIASSQDPKIRDELVALIKQYGGENPCPAEKK